MKKKQNTDITGFEVTKCPTVKPEDSFQSSRYRTFATRCKLSAKRRKDFIFKSKEKMVKKLVKQIGVEK